jgi:hypothetical protein
MVMIASLDLLGAVLSTLSSPLPAIMPLFDGRHNAFKAKPARPVSRANGQAS